LVLPSFRLRTPPAILRAMLVASRLAQSRRVAFAAFLQVAPGIRREGAPPLQLLHTRRRERGANVQARLFLVLFARHAMLVQMGPHDGLVPPATDGALDAIQQRVKGQYARLAV
jgi:hypothetical protein